MENKENILEVENLQVSFHTYAGEVKAVRGVSLLLRLITKASSGV